MFEHVLVGIDFSSAWDRLRARLKVLHQSGSKRVSLVYVMSTRYPAAPEETHRAHYQELLDREACTIRKLGLETDTEILVGEPGAELAAAAARRKADLLLLGARGHSRVYTFLMGSTAMDAAAGRSCPSGSSRSSASRPSDRAFRCWRPTDPMPLPAPKPCSNAWRHSIGSAVR